MKELETWKGASFEYIGSIESGVVISFGKKPDTEEITQIQCKEILKKFTGFEVLVGASRTTKHSNSFGYWLMEKIKTKRVITSYISSILVEEGYAFFVNSHPAKEGGIIKFN